MSRLDITQVMADLRNEKVPLNRELLFSLSDLNATGKEALSKTWVRIEVERRRKLMSALVDLAENAFEVDFNSIFRVALDDEDAEIRSQAISELWEDDSPNLIGPLLKLLSEDRSEQVRAQAAESLGRFVLLGELGKLDMRVAFAVQEALLQTYQSSPDALEVKCRALASLAYSGDEGVLDLIDKAYREGDDRLATCAIFSMGRSADPRWSDIVIRELSNSKPEFRFDAAQASGELELIEAVHPLGELAEQDPDTEVRIMAIWALGQIGGHEARRTIESLQETEQDDVILGALQDAEEELGFHDDALDMSFVENWLGDELDLDEIIDQDDDDDDTYGDNGDDR